MQLYAHAICLPCPCILAICKYAHAHAHKPPWPTTMPPWSALRKILFLFINKNVLHDHQVSHVYTSTCNSSQHDCVIALDWLKVFDANYRVKCTSTWTTWSVYGMMATLRALIASNTACQGPLMSICISCMTFVSYCGNWHAWKGSGK